MIGERRFDLVVTDLDGTLWDRQGRIDEETLSSIDRLAQAGIPLLAATARRRRSAVEHLEPHGLALPLVLLDGSLGFDPSDGSRFHRSAFEPTDAAHILEQFTVRDVEPCLNVDDERDVIIGPRPSSHPDNVAYLDAFGTRDHLPAVVAASAVLSFQVYGVPFEVVAPVAEAIASGGWAEATVSTDISHGGAALSVRPVGTSKWAGVLSYCRKYDIDPARTAAIGDGENDVELLSGAGRSFAPAGASRAAVAMADTVVAEQGRGGWAEMVDAVLGRA